MRFPDVAVTILFTMLAVWVIGMFYPLMIKAVRWVNDDDTKVDADSTSFAKKLHNFMGFSGKVEYFGEWTSTCFATGVATIIVALAFYNWFIATIVIIGIAIPIVMYVARYIVRARKVLRECKEKEE